MTASVDLKSNPLINPPQLPNNALPLNKVRSKHIVPAIEYGLAQLRAEIDAIKNNPDQPTFANTIEALEFAGEDLDRASTVLGLLLNSQSTGVLRKIDKKTGPVVSQFFSELYQDRDLFARVEAVYKDPASAHLGVEEKMLLKAAYDGFANNGIHLPLEQQKRMQKIKSRLSVLTSKFSENVLKETEAYKYFITDEAVLDGVPDRVKSEYRQSAVKAGKPDQWLITLEPFPNEIISHGKNRALREEIYRADNVVAHGEHPKFDNRPIQLEIVALKNELAHIMGFETTADYIISENMARDAKTVEAFLRGNLAVYKPAAEEYLQKIRDFAKEQDGLEELKPWDVPYYGRALKEKIFSIDFEALRPYFELKSTFNDLARHAEEAFGVELRSTKKSKYPVHNKDVDVYEAFDKASNSFVGLFYVNYYAKPGAKSGGAWMDEIQSHYVDKNGQVHTPSITNDCNYKRRDDGGPTLLAIGDKRTDFHEFGHAMHGMKTRVKYKSQAGTRVKRDWVELPSQLQEGWVMAKAKDRNDPFATHFETGEKIPLDILERIQEMQNFDAGYVGLRQTYFGLLDLKWHTTDPATIVSVDALEDEVAAEASLLPRVHGAMSTSFTHIFSGGYSAGYYGYKWADVMAADVFARSQEKGMIYDRAFLKDVMTIIYETGGSRDPAELYRELMGRDPDPDALFLREGLLKRAPQPGPWPFPKSPSV
jgi:peptidyl-dipeptidase Dcp